MYTQLTLDHTLKFQRTPLFLTSMHLPKENMLVDSYIEDNKKLSIY